MQDDTTPADSSTDTERNPTTLTKDVDDIRPGDVVLDLAQGRPMQVIGHAADSVEEWEERHDYDLLGNYGNARLGTTVADPVYTCVYVSNLKSEPSNQYDFPAARLGRVEVEAAHPDRDRVQDTLRRETLTRMFGAALGYSDDRVNVLEELAQVAFDGKDHQLIRDARELAETRRADGGDQ